MDKVKTDELLSYVRVEYNINEIKTLTIIKNMLKYRALMKRAYEKS